MMDEEIIFLQSTRKKNVKDFVEYIESIGNNNAKYSIVSKY